MDKIAKEVLIEQKPLIERLNIILTKIKEKEFKESEHETELLIKEVKRGFVPPF